MCVDPHGIVPVTSTEFKYLFYLENTCSSKFYLALLFIIIFIIHLFKFTLKINV